MEGRPCSRQLVEHSGIRGAETGAAAWEYSAAEHCLEWILPSEALQGSYSMCVQIQLFRSDAQLGACDPARIHCWPAVSLTTAACACKHRVVNSIPIQSNAIQMMKRSPLLQMGSTPQMQLFSWSGSRGQFWRPGTANPSLAAMPCRAQPLLQKPTWRSQIVSTPG